MGDSPPSLHYPLRKQGYKTRYRPSRNPLPGKPDQPFAHLFGQGPGVAGVEAQLDRRRDLVDVLTAGTGGADEPLLDVALVHADLSRDPDHRPMVSAAGRFFEQQLKPDAAASMKTNRGSRSARNPRSRITLPLIGLEDLGGAAGHLADADIVQSAVQFGAAHPESRDVGVTTETDVVRGAGHRGGKS